MNHGEKAAYTHAKTQGLWIYEVNSKRWFSPGEFEKIIDEHGSLGPGTEFELRDPFQALIEANQTIAGMIHRKNHFESRVLAWARENLKGG